MLARGAHSILLTANTTFCATNMGKQPVCHETAKCLLLPSAGCPNLVLLIFSETYSRLSGFKCFIGFCLFGFCLFVCVFGFVFEGFFVLLCCVFFFKYCILE